ncbi:MAG: PilZ domain-containing protein [Sphingomonadaceae bacterium]|nr:PilZ domain-containing protein [Sphingomonadaceae bacterium]
MNGNENRQIGRDSLFVMADFRIDGMEGEHRIKVRNLSAGGLMGEGPVRVPRGAVVDVNIRNVGWVEGSVAWVQDERFGMTFREEIDPRLARATVASVSGEGRGTPRFARSPLPVGKAGALRKI